jgi:hypothetical protein
MPRNAETIRANIAAQKARHDHACWQLDGRYTHQHGPITMTPSEAMDVIGKAARRLYNLRRELARIEA